MATDQNLNNNNKIIIIIIIIIITKVIIRVFFKFFVANFAVSKLRFIFIVNDLPSYALSTLSKYLKCVYNIILKHIHA